MSIVKALVHMIQSKAGEAPVELGLILGSGMSGLAESLEGVRIPYSDLPGFPRASVTGHDPHLVVGEIMGRRVALFGAREHYYENGRADAMRLPLEVLVGLGASKLLITNAAGSMRSDIPPGEVMLIADHLNYNGMNPLIGEASDARFVNMKDAYDPSLRATLQEIARGEGIYLKEGTYAWYSGPSFETLAEIRALRTLGADAVGMSTVPEVILARFLGLRVAAMSVITNMAAGMSDEVLSHEHTKEMAPKGAEKVSRILRAWLKD